jgi:molybdenum cofactor guanylyltransferase
MGNIAGIILCGGESRRMGRSKAALPFGPSSLLEQVASIVGSVCAPVLVVASAEQELPKLPASIPVVRDTVAREGPLRGFATGLAALPESAELVFLASTDAPFVSPAWITRLVELIGDNDMIVTTSGEKDHPFAALYRRSTVLPAATALLESDCRRLRALKDRVLAKLIPAEAMRDIDPGLDSLRNLNTPDEYAKAHAERTNGSAP